MLSNKNKGAIGTILEEEIGKLVLKKKFGRKLMDF